MKKFAILVTATLLSGLLCACTSSAAPEQNAATKTEQTDTPTSEAPDPLDPSQPTDPSAQSDSEDRFAPFLNERDYLCIVNEQNPYVFGGIYDVTLQDDLVYAADVVDGDPVGVERAAYLAFTLLQHSLAQDGMNIGLYDGYRTAEQQQEVYDYYGSLEGWAETNKVVKPGYSEHHTGLLLNVVIWYEGEDGKAMWYTETAERQQSIPYFKLLHERLADFGFIDRYPAGHEDHTGMPCEPYEIRFVGSSKIAHEITDNNLCLDEYLELTKSGYTVEDLA